MLNMIDVSLSLDKVPPAFKVAVIKPQLKKPLLDPAVFAHYRPIFRHPPISKILETANWSFAEEQKFQSGFSISL